MSKTKVLWVLPKYTFPINDGARVASNSLAKSFATTVDQLDVLVLAAQDESSSIDEYKKNWNAQDVDIIKRPSQANFIHKLIVWLIHFIKHPLLPLTISNYNRPQLSKKVAQTIENRTYDLIVFDGLHSWASFILASKIDSFKDTKFIYRAHNVEQDLWTTAASKTYNPFKKMFINYQSYIMGKFEGDLIQKSHTTWAISEEDNVRFSSIYSQASFDTIPVGLNFTKLPHEKSVPKNPQDPIQILFIGRLDWPPNKEGLTWFLNNVWPQIIANRNDLILNIAGSGNSSWVSKYEALKGVKFLGFVDDLGELYRQVDLSIMPIFFGSGTRIKVIESVSFGVPIISSAVGVQGSGLIEGDYITAELADQWIQKLTHLQRVDLQNTAKEAWNRLNKLLDATLVAQKAFNSLKVLKVPGSK